jgi:hypothetical protein
MRPLIMSSKSSAPFIIVNLIPSRTLLMALGAFHLWALAGLIVCALPLFIVIPLGGVVILSFIWNYRRYGDARSRWFIEQVRCLPSGEWILRTADGVERPVQWLGGYPHPYLLILNFALGKFARRSVVVLPDSADSHEIRRLRVYLRTQVEES